MVKSLQFELGLCEADLHMDAVLSSHYPYEQGQVWVIHPSGLSTQALNAMDVIKCEDCTIKVEGYEKLSRRLFDAVQSVAQNLNHNGPVTCHLFRSPKGAASFPAHTDPDDVVLYIVSGTKTIELEDRVATLGAGEVLYLPRGTIHRAVNHDASLMLSIGLELFTVEKL